MSTKTVYTRFIIILLIVASSAVENADANEGKTLINRLNNGMDVVLVENNSVPMIACNIIIRAGSRDETWRTWGAAHFLEHLLFNGTEDRSQEEIYSEFDQIGAFHNAHTGSHFTDFMLFIAGENFPKGFDILTDMVFNSNLPPHKFEKERGIVMEEIARSSTMQNDYSLIVKHELYSESPLSRQVLGTVESIGGLERDSVMAFYRKWYVPNNMMLFVTGEFEADTMFTWLQQKTSVFQPDELIPRRKIAPPDFSSFDDMGIIYRSLNIKKRQVFIVSSVPGPGHADYPALNLLNIALDRRLEEKLPSGSSGGAYMMNDPDHSTFWVSLSAPAVGNSAAGLVKILDEIISDLVKRPPDKEEIERLSRRYLADRIFDAEMLNHFGIMYASEWALASWDEFSSWPDRIANLTPDRLRKVTDRWLLDQKRMIMSLEPAAKSDTASQENIGGGIKRFEDAGKPTLIVRHDPTARVMGLQIIFKNRWLFDKEYGAGAVNLLHCMLGEYSEGRGKTLTGELDNLAAKLKVIDSPYIPFDNYYTTPAWSFIRLEILPDAWQEGINLIGRIMKKPSFTTEALDAANSKAAAGKSSQSRSPIEQGRNKLRNFLFPESVWSASVYGETSYLKRESLAKLWDAYFQNDNMIVAVSGPVEHEEVKEIVYNTFRNFVSDESANAEKIIFMPSDSSINAATWRDTVDLGSSQGAIVMGRVVPEIELADRPALLLANSYFNHLLASELRETKGLAYSLGSSLNFQQGSGEQLWAYWEIYIGTRQENFSEAADGIQDLIIQLSEHQFTDEEIDRQRNSLTGRLMMRNMSRISQAYSMAVGEFSWNDPEWRNKLIDQILEVTPLQVENVIKKYIQAGDMARVIVK